MPLAGGGLRNLGPTARKSGATRNEGLCRVSAALVQQPQEEVFGPDLFVSKRPGFIEGGVECLASLVVESFEHDGTGYAPNGRRTPPSQLNLPAVTERLEVQRAIAAEPVAIFRLLADPHGHVAIDSSGMLMDASGSSVRAVDDSFVVRMDREALGDHPLGLYDVTVRIVRYEEDHELAWTVQGNFNLGHVYGYRLDAIDGGTLVTSYYEWSGVDQEWKDANIFPVGNARHPRPYRCPG